MGKTNKKEAFAVFRGVVPGVYNSWHETEPHVKGFPCCSFRGYTHGQGGKEAAERDFKKFIEATVICQVPPAITSSDLGQAPRNNTTTLSSHIHNSDPSENGRSVGGKTPNENHKQDPQAWERASRKLSSQSESDRPKKVLKNHSVLHDTPFSTSTASSSAKYTSSPSSNESIENVLRDVKSRPWDAFNPIGKLETSYKLDAGPHSIRTPTGSIFPLIKSEEAEPSFSIERHENFRTTSNDIKPKLSKGFDEGTKEEYDEFDCDSILDEDLAQACSQVDKEDRGFTLLNARFDNGPSHKAAEKNITAIAALKPTSGVPTPSQEPILCKEQEVLIEVVVDGKHVFYTGPAGCGKSTVLRVLVRRLKDMGKIVDIIAPTGMAALSIGGSTIHYYAGWRAETKSQPLKKIMSDGHRKKVWERLRQTDVLVIDEISMVSNHDFERLNCLMQEARGNDRPFGGVQLIVTGDFCQLPPVKPFEFCLYCGSRLKQDKIRSTFKCPQTKKCGEVYFEKDKWAFRSQAWEEAQFTHINLSTIHRQRDPVFQALLEKIRLGKVLSCDEEDLLLKNSTKDLQGVKLFPTREEVASVNRAAFKLLDPPQYSFRCHDDYLWNDQHSDLRNMLNRDAENDSLAGLNSHRFEPELDMKKGMPVILLANINVGGGLVNGSQGIIIDFTEQKEYMCTPPRPEDEDARKEQFKFDSLKAFADRASQKLWPVVRFRNGLERVIYPRCEVNEFGESEPRTLLGRTQIPLIAGWAMTVHKAQGMTLAGVELNLGKSFEKGLMYVAVSRAQTLEGLKIKALPARHQGADLEVQKFLYEKFEIT